MARHELHELKQFKGLIVVKLCKTSSPAPAEPKPQRSVKMHHSHHWFLTSSNIDYRLRLPTRLSWLGEVLVLSARSFLTFARLKSDSDHLPPHSDCPAWSD